MDTNQSLLLTDKAVINSNIEDKYMNDYGLVTAVYSSGGVVTTVDVTHYANAGVDASGNLLPDKSYKIEVLYPATAGVSIEIPVAVGDGVLLVGTRRYVRTVKDISGAPKKPQEKVSYVKTNLKAIPVNALSSSSEMYMRFKAGKMQLKNATKSLYTVLDNFESAVQTFSGATSQSAITAGNSTSVTLAAALNLLLVSLNASVTTAKADLALILEA